MKQLADLPKQDKLFHSEGATALKEKRWDSRLMLYRLATTPLPSSIGASGLAFLPKVFVDVSCHPLCVLLADRQVPCKNGFLALCDVQPDAAASYAHVKFRPLKHHVL